MRVSLVQVPYLLGDERRGGPRGPGRLLEPARELLARRGVAVETTSVHWGGVAPDPLSGSFGVNQALAETVRGAVAAGRLPIVLAASCDASAGILAAFDHSRCGVLWLDAHGDFNTPQSSRSGFLPGMALAVLAGDCHREHWSRLGDGTPVPAEGIVLLGVRDLDPAEDERLAASVVQMVPWRKGEPLGDPAAALDRLARRAGELYLHIDLDALDGSVAPGMLDPPLPGGMSLEQMEAIVRAAAPRFRLRAATLTTYKCDGDFHDRTLAATLRLIDVIATSRWKAS